MPVQEARFRILSVDGGGVRGLVPALVLVELEQRLEALTGHRRPLSDYFHLFAGTSTGGLISLGLTARRPDDRDLPSMDGERLVSLYRDRGPKIFPPRFRLIRKLRGFVIPKFSNRALRRAVEEDIGTAPLSTALRDLVITAYDMTDHHPRFFKRWTAGQGGRPDPTMAEAAIATASAPTYLPPWEVDGKALVDGGVFAANPTIAAVAEALKRQTDEPTRLVPHELFVVSLGTGFYKAKYAPRRLRGWGALAWIWPRGSEPALMRAMLDGQTASADQWAHMILNHQPGDAPPTRADVGHGPRYFRLESELATDFEMDDARRKTLEGLSEAASKLIEERGNDLQVIAERLAAAGPV
ncbi:MAG: patatin-like phospholipase family protein [Solirubrobacterales bacterium]